MSYPLELSNILTTLSTPPPALTPPGCRGSASPDAEFLVHGSQRRVNRASGKGKNKIPRMFVWWEAEGELDRQPSRLWRSTKCLSDSSGYPSCYSKSWGSQCPSHYSDEGSFKSSEMMKAAKSGNVRKLKARVCKHDNQRVTSCKLYIKNVYTLVLVSFSPDFPRGGGQPFQNLNFSFKSNPINIEFIIAQNYKCTGSPP